MRRLNVPLPRCLLPSPWLRLCQRTFLVVRRIASASWRLKACEEIVASNPRARRPERCDGKYRAGGRGASEWQDSHSPRPRDAPRGLAYRRYAMSSAQPRHRNVQQTCLQPLGAFAGCGSARPSWAAPYGAGAGTPGRTVRSTAANRCGMATRKVDAVGDMVRQGGGGG
jgi:hypothetical protein